MQSRTSTTDWPSILMVVFCTICILFLFAAAGLLVFSGSFQLLVPSSETDVAAAASTILLGIGAAFGGLLVLPALYYNWQRLNGKPVSDASVRPVRIWQVLILLAISLVTVFLGNLLIQEISWAAILLPVFYLLAVVLPILIIVWISIGGLSMGTRRRAWSIFTMGMVLGPFSTTVVEIIFFIVLFLVMIFYLALQPDLVNQLLQMSEQLVTITDPQAILDLMLPYLTNPFVLIIGFASITLVVPLIEELLKPAGIWLLGRKALTAQEGFALGILSGAAFAIFESLGNGSNATQDWGILVLARIGTDLVHILGTGLMGWAMASTWQDKKYLRLLGMYLLVVLNHGIWNAQAILIATNGLAEYVTDVLPAMTWLPVVLITGMGLQTAAMAGALIWMNRRLRPKAEPVPETVV